MSEPAPDLVGVARAHAAAEAAGDLEATLATLDPEPVYELWPMGVTFRGEAAARAYYEHFCNTVRPLVSSAELRNEWVNDHGVAQEYEIEFRLPEGTERHRVLAILTFGESALSGERLYGSDRLFGLLFGPVLELARPVAGPGVERAGTGPVSDRKTGPGDPHFAEPID